MRIDIEKINNGFIVRSHIYAPLTAAECEECVIFVTTIEEVPAILKRFIQKQAEISERTKGNQGAVAEVGTAGVI